MFKHQFSFHFRIYTYFCTNFKVLGKTAIILGASGLIGSSLLSFLIEADEYELIKVFVRKPLHIGNNKVQELITDFKDLEKLNSQINADVVFSCLGSTKSKTPNLQDYKKVDYGIPLYYAKTLNKNLTSFHLVSSIGANSKSINFYTKLKGEIEDDLKLLGLNALHIYQPSFLEGDRKEKRVSEKVWLLAFKIINPLLVGPLKKFKSIKAADVAKAMYINSLEKNKGVFTYTTEQIKDIAWVH